MGDYPAAAGRRPCIGIRRSPSLSPLPGHRRSRRPPRQLGRNPAFPRQPGRLRLAARAGALLRVHCHRDCAVSLRCDRDCAVTVTALSLVACGRDCAVTVAHRAAQCHCAVTLRTLPTAATASTAQCHCHGAMSLRCPLPDSANGCTCLLSTSRPAAAAALPSVPLRKRRRQGPLALSASRRAPRDPSPSSGSTHSPADDAGDSERPSDQERAERPGTEGGVAHGAGSRGPGTRPGETRRSGVRAARLGRRPAGVERHDDSDARAGPGSSESMRPRARGASPPPACGVIMARPTHSCDAINPSM